MRKALNIKDFSKHGDTQLTVINFNELMPLPPPYGRAEEQPRWEKITDGQKERLMCNLDGVVATNLTKPKNVEVEKRYIELFLSGLRKLLSQEDNWTFLQPLLLSIDYCAQCQTCNDACPIYLASGENDLYRPTYRSEIFNAWLINMPGEVGSS